MINGDEDIRILKHAFLNSYFQTGLQGNIDEAVINRGLENGMEEYLVARIAIFYSRKV